MYDNRYDTIFLYK